MLVAAGRQPKGPPQLSEWRERHSGLHSYETLRAEIDARYDERHFEWRPYFYLWLEGPATESLEAGLIAAGAIRPIGFRYAGVRRGQNARRPSRGSPRRAFLEDRGQALRTGASSSVMSAPPISSPPTKTCGIVGQPESADSSCADRRIREDVDRRHRRAGLAERPQRTIGVAAHDELRRPLHEHGDGLVLDHILNPLANSLIRFLSS